MNADFGSPEKGGRWREKDGGMGEKEKEKIYATLGQNNVWCEQNPHVKQGIT